MNDMNYDDFLDTKRITSVAAGFDLPESAINSQLFGFQRDIVRWAIRRGRAAILADCGLGKSAIQLEWAQHVANHTGGSVLILAPLAVAQQTVREGQKFGIDVDLCRTQADVRQGINITNYEKLQHFEPSAFAGVVLDESSILKSYSGSTRNQIIDLFAQTSYKLACTATPAPNDHMELGNHAEFLGAMTRTEMLSMFFVHDGGDTSKWRLKGHAEREFWKWVCTWAVMVRKPSDLGYADDGFILPELHLHEQVIETDVVPDGYLFAVEAKTLLEQRIARKSTLSERVSACAELVNSSDRPWLIWCDLNAEGDALAAAIPDAIQVAGSDKEAVKEERMLGFTEGKYRVLVTKPSVAGFGMNWQHCADVAFVGLSNSYEQFYQALRRCWRFGQQNEVHCHIITSDLEGSVLVNIKRKEADAMRMAEEMTTNMQLFQDVHSMQRDKAIYECDIAAGPDWAVHLGDCVEMVRGLQDESIDYSIFSPPFASLYTYSNSERDMGNCKSTSEFYQHFVYLVENLYRVLKSGRLLSFHCMNLPLSLQHDGVIGIRDFRGDLIRIFQECGFIYHSEVVIWKDPVVAMQRTKALGLLYKQLKKDSCMSRQGIPDYLVTMRKVGDNARPVTKDPIVFPVDRWQRYASPIWMDINQSNTLQKESAREERDEKHVCPLQLEVIERAIELWTSPGDLVLDPFTGIGSTGHVGVKLGRRFVGAELKRSYWKQAVANLRIAEHQKAQPTLFDLLEEAA